MDIQQILLLVAIGVSAGFLSGLFGVGGGIIIVPGLVFLLGMTQKEAQGTSLALMLLPIGILAVTNYHKSGNINFTYGIIIALTFVLGGFFGSKLAIAIDEGLIKKIFGGLMFLISLKLIFGK